MKRVLIITYDLVNPGQNYQALLQAIKASPTWARLGGSSYLIFTEQTPVQVRDDLMRVLDRNDKLYVGVAPPPAAWTGMPEEVSNWIRTNQTGS
jgi:hypothetical protein